VPKAPVNVVPETTDKERVAEEKRRLAEAGVEYCFAAWVDIHGRPKAKLVPLERFEDLTQGSEMYTVQAFDGMGKLGPQVPDQAVLPDLDTLTVCPWDHRYAWMTGDLYWQGEPYEYCSRTILKRMIRRAAEKGYALNLGIEPEFYILRSGQDGRRSEPFHSSDKGPCWGYDIESTLDAMPVLDHLRRCLDELGWEVDSFDHEGGHSQYEFDFTYADVLKMCDRFSLLRLLIKEVAKQHGAFATFMPKPFANDFRSGAHFNMSLRDAGSGSNLMRDKGDPRGIGFSALAYRFIAGLLKHAHAMAAVCAPTVNSYKGLIPGGIDPTGVARDMSWAPVYVAYGDNNRSLMLRLPHSRDCVENRVPDIATNPYWAAAIHLAAGLDGIEQSLDPGQPQNANLYEMTHEQLAQHGVSFLPRTLAQALDAFERDPITEVAFGAGPKDEYLRLKWQEWERFHAEITDWEWERYANFF
jgi:glutamine synthetase